MTRYWRRMRRLIALGGAVGSLAMVAIASPALAADPTGTLSGVETKPGSVRFVLSADDLPAGTQLDASTLRVTLGGTKVPAKAEPVTSTAAPVARTAVLAIDTSGSMKGPGIVAARAAALAFLRDVPADVRVGLVTFESSTRVLVQPTTDRAKLAASVNGLSADDGDTSLYDGVRLSLATLGETATQRSLVVLSDGKDTASRASLSSAVASVKESGANAQFVSLTTKDTDSRALGRLAAAGNGTLLTASDAAQLADAFRAAAQTFVTQVVVTAQVPEALAGATESLGVEVAAGDATVAAQSQVDLAAVESAGGSTGSPGADSSAWSRALLITLVAFGLGLFALFVVALNPSLLRNQGRKRTQQLARYSMEARSAGSTTQDPETHGAIAATALEWADRAVKKRGVEEKIALQLDRAAMPFRPHEWVLIRASAAAGLTAVLFLVTGSLVVSLVLGPVVGLLATHMLVAVRASRRLKTFEQQLPDTLQLVASSLQSGFSLPQALDAAVREGEQPIAGEFARALAEARLGQPVEDALDKVADRMDSEDFRWIVMAIRIQREVGGNLAEVLSTTVKTMRERASVHRQVRALSAEGRLSAYILIALPLGVALFTWTFRREYMSPLWTELFGVAMSAGAVFLMTVGWLWMRKLVRVEV
ncbi:MAG: type II secretion system F family protein [Actinomycetes bacterium]